MKLPRRNLEKKPEIRNEKKKNPLAPRIDMYMVYLDFSQRNRMISTLCFFFFFIFLNMVLKQLILLNSEKEVGGGGGGGEVGGSRSCQNQSLNRPFYGRGLSKDVRLSMTLF